MPRSEQRSRLRHAASEDMMAAHRIVTGSHAPYRTPIASRRLSTPWRPKPAGQPPHREVHPDQRGDQRHRRRRDGLRGPICATGRPRTVTRSVSPAPTRRSTPETSLRSSRGGCHRPGSRGRSSARRDRGERLVDRVDIERRRIEISRCVEPQPLAHLVVLLVAGIGERFA